MSKSEEIRVVNDADYDPDLYFSSHPELFTAKRSIVKTIILGGIALVMAYFIYVFWFTPEVIETMFENSSIREGSRKENKAYLLFFAIKWVSTLGLPIVLLLLFAGGANDYFDKKSGGKISPKYMVKHISSEHIEVREWFMNGEFDKILALPVSSSYFNKDVSVFTLAHNPEANTFYAFCEYVIYNPQSHGKAFGDVESDRLLVKQITEPQYSALMPMVAANLKAIKEVEHAETKEKNIVVTPKLS